MHQDADDDTDLHEDMSKDMHKHTDEDMCQGTR